MMQSTSPVTTPAVSILFILSKTHTHLNIIHILMGSQGSSAGVVTRMRVGRYWVQFSAGAKDSTLSPTQASYYMGSMGEVVKVHS